MGKSAQAAEARIAEEKELERAKSMNTPKEKVNTPWPEPPPLPPGLTS